VDGIFTRMGAQDRIMLGQSTFAVEMAEASLAMQLATPASLLVMDELGRRAPGGRGQGGARWRAGDALWLARCGKGGAAP
jgi:hypothetical protein